MAKKNGSDFAHIIHLMPLWELDIKEMVGRNLEAKGRQVVNRLLGKGWMLLHVYTLRYEQDGVWRDRPMAILGRSGRGAKESKSL